MYGWHFVFRYVVYLTAYSFIYYISSFFHFLHHFNRIDIDIFSLYARWVFVNPMKNVYSCKLYDFLLLKTFSDSQQCRHYQTSRMTFITIRICFRFEFEWTHNLWRFKWCITLCHKNQYVRIQTYKYYIYK